MTNGPRRRRIDRRAFLAAAGLAAGATALGGCAATGAASSAPSAPPTEPTRFPVPPSPVIDLAAPAADVVARAADVPVLCWHQLRDHRPDDSAYARQVLICPPATFRDQLDGLQAAGYRTISPEEHLAHLTTGAPLPPRPVMLTFDDSQGSQITAGLPALRRRRMTGTFFVMTVPLGQPDWMTRDDVRRLHGEGMTVAAHTWDHHRVDRYAGDDWRRQLDQPRAELEAIVGAPVPDFAYPFGAWAPSGFEHLAAAGYRSGYQLTEQPVDPSRPLLTLRRSLVDSRWSGADLVAHLQRPA